MIPDSGWLTSCAIEAVKAPRVETLATCAQIRSGLAESLFRESPLCHVLDRADVLDADRFGPVLRERTSARI